MKNYTTKTAALNAVTVDTRILDAKRMLLNGKNILDYISDSEFNSYDTRDPQLKNDELDLWNTEISLSDNGHIEVKPHVHGMSIDLDTGEFNLEGITESQIEIIRTAVKVIDNEVLGENDEHIMYWQTDGVKDMLGMFAEDSNLVSFSSDLSNVTISYGMFASCQNLESFSSDLSNLTIGIQMFYNCNTLTSFTTELPRLMGGIDMFQYCTNLTTFTSDLPSLMDGQSMFQYCTNLTTFTSDLPSLADGRYMFGACDNLTSFSSDLSSLADGGCMFWWCDNLTSFSSDLSSLTNGNDMFNNCKLDAQSVANIVHTLPTHESNGEITIGIGCDNTEVDQLLFAQECDCETWQELLDEFSAKNWTITFQCNGRPTEAATYNMRRGETLPIYAKLEEVIMPTNEKERKPYEKERKPHYAYTSQDGTKLYNIHWFHSTNGSTEGYDVFSSLEEAISTYNVTPKTNN